MTKPVIILEWNSPPISHLETLCLLQTPHKDSWWISCCQLHMIVLTGLVPQYPNCSYWWPVSIKLASQCCISKAISLSESRYLVLDFYAYPLLIKFYAKSICCLIDPCQYIQGIEPHESLLYIISLILCSLIGPKEIYSTSWKKSKPTYILT